MRAAHASRRRRPDLNLRGPPQVAGGQERASGRCRPSPAKSRKTQTLKNRQRRRTDRPASGGDLKLTTVSGGRERALDQRLGPGEDGVRRRPASIPWRGGQTPTLQSVSGDHRGSESKAGQRTSTWMRAPCPATSAPRFRSAATPRRPAATEPTLVVRGKERQRRLPGLPRELMQALLTRRDVRLLLAGAGTLSMFGDWAMIIVLAIWAKVLTGSNAQARAGVLRVRSGRPSRPPSGGASSSTGCGKRPLMIATHLALAASHLPAPARARIRGGPLASLTS